MTKRTGLILSLLLLLLAGAFYFIPRLTGYAVPLPGLPQSTEKKAAKEARFRKEALSLKRYTRAKGLNTEVCFLIDMQQPSGRKRFAVYDLQNDTILQWGLVAHGSCNKAYLDEPQFSNVPECGCSSTGKYKVGYAYAGRFGKAYKLFGLESTNSNAFKRHIVLHAYDCVPDREIYPQPLCNSLGCPMVSYAFLKQLAGIIDNSDKPILLSIIP